MTTLSACWSRIRAPGSPVLLLLSMCSVGLLNHKPKLVRIIKLIAMMNVVVDVCVKIVGQSVVRDAIAWWQRRLVSWSEKAA